MSELAWEPDLVVASYHGIPKNILAKETLTIAIVKKPRDCYLKNLNKFQLKLHFNQDLVLKNGLQPYTDKTLKIYQKRVKKILVICPGFHRIVSKL